ncbi:hypothetical protein POJ06DRAFT_104201 [Lipomyces tetrasporus]|uniref:Ribosomal RNA-processing protein 40 n=1 Tax=Lipomyces tetrasporus TaxID=54092 RepID=A0AAD7VSX4_9ASCO|nr:uncharacterized protein POJ06DRAFT_104201 [Lipomyces tetrasporus]KAJ8100421.1 hypothetical protein POJ06DRAFT_104201 [Lipomyces tetrasporus]
MSSEVILPGDPIPLDSVIGDNLDDSDSGPVIQLGPGVLHIPPETLLPIRAGTLTTVARSKPQKSTTIYVDTTGGRYVPAVHDTILGTVIGRFGDQEKSFYRVSIPGSAAPIGILSSAAFANAASRHTRPNLSNGTTVYARISAFSIALGEPELECFDENTGKEGGFGELKGGMLADVSNGLARRLLAPSGAYGGPSVVDVLGKLVPFEIAVGRNGRIWIDSESCKMTAAIITAIQETEELPRERMEERVQKIIKGARKE